MSLMKTLAKVAIGVAVAKGASAMMNKGGGSAQASSGGLGGLLGGLMGGGSAGAAGQSSAGLGGLLGGLTGGSGGSGGGLQDMLGGLTGGTSGASAGGGLQDMLGGLLSGAQGGGGGMAGGLGGMLESLGGGQAAGGQSGGGLGGLLGGLAGAAGAGGLMGAAMKQRPAENNASFGSVLNSAFDANPQDAIEPTADQEAAAGLMLRAMIQATKADGNLDDSEREKLLGQLGDEVDSAEAAFVQSELQAPMDVQGLAAQVPNGMEQQIYAMSLMAINLDSQEEAQYLHSLAQAIGMDVQAVNAVHSQLGVQSLYT